MSGLDILIPCKGFAIGKSRLAPALAEPERAALCRRFLHTTIRRAGLITVSGAPVVASDDPDVLDEVVRLGAVPLPTPYVGANADVASANATLLRDAVSANRLLVLPIDLPLATPAILRAFLRRGNDMTLAPNREGTGTNLLLLGPDLRRDFPFSFGPGSRSLHVAAARERGAAAVIVCDARLGLDVDDPADLREWQRRIGRGSQATASHARSSVEARRRLDI